LFLFAAVEPFVIVRDPNCVRREELTNREFDVTEDCTGIFVAAAVSGTAGTIFLRHAVIVDRNQQLRIPLQADNGKLSQSHIDSAGIISEGKGSVEAITDERGNFTEIAVTVTLAAVFHNTGVKNNGIDGLDHGVGNITSAQHLQIRLAGFQLGRENLGVSFAAEKNDTFVKDTQTLYRNGNRTTEIGLQSNRVEKSQINGEEPPVKAYGFHIYIDVQQSCGAAFYRECAIDDIHILQLRVEPQILDAVFVSAGIINFAGVNTYSFANTVTVRNGTGNNFVGHWNTS
jgi:hypothetical protein